MAQIQIEERRRGLGWLWAIIAIVLLALVVWYFTANNDAAVDDTPTTTAPATPTTIDAPAAIEPAAAA